jgi:adenosylmethionine-8-amino-7-oxononanoate transaminase
MTPAPMSLTTAELRDLDRRHLWHPFTHQSLWLADDPLVITDADGCDLIDSDGNRYIDGVASIWCNVHGHRVPQIDAALREQLARVAHTTLLGLTNEPATRLAAKLCAMTGLDRCFFADAGACATEVAFKLAVQYWANVGRPERREFVGFADGYHGDTVGAMSVGRSPAFQRAFTPLLFPVHVAPAPYEYRFPIADCRLPNDEASSQSAIGNRRSAIVRREALANVERLLERHHATVAAIAVEPLIQAAAGIVTHPPGFLRGLRELADRYGVLLICDEIAVGFGRTGRMFACEHEGVRPDLMTVGKGLTGGYLPLAATLTTSRIHDAFFGEPWSGRTFFHGHTFTGNPLACAAALASIELFATNDVLGNVNARSAELASMLARLSAHRFVGDVRQRGLMAGVELVADRAAKRPFDPRARVGAALCQRLRRHGVILRPLGDVIAIVPPLAIDAGRLRRIVDAIATELDAIDAPAAPIEGASVVDPAGDA